MELMKAVNEGSVERVQELIENGVNQGNLDSNVDERDKYGGTALMRACKSGKTEIVELLLTSGANIDAKTDWGWTVLMTAVSEHGLMIEIVVNLLIEKGAKIEEKNKNGDTALMRAAFWGRTRNVEILLEHGAKINERGESGMTALMYASQWERAPVAKMLLEHGADIDMKNKNGKTAYDIASSTKMKNVLKKSISHHMVSKNAIIYK